METKLKKNMKNLSFSILANVVTLVVSVVATLVLPKFMSNTEYGYWTLYLLYVSYVGFFHLGWIDGIYLRLGGKAYQELDKRVLNSQFWLVNSFELLITLIVSILLIWLVPNDYKLPILLLSIFNIIPTIPKTFFLYVLQATNRISEYGIITIIEKISFCIVLLVGLMCGVKSVFVIMLFDLFSKFIALILSVYYCKDIVIRKLKIQFPDIKEAWVNISVGIKLMMANVAGMLILGIIRLSIENVWDIETFGKVSLVMSVSNLLMIFINAIGVVLFPLLRRMKDDKLSTIYGLLRTVLMVFIFSMLVVYYPGRILLSNWLPQYRDSLRYMALMFPICIFEGKMSLLINTYLKTLRKEKTMMSCNIISVLLSLIVTYVVVVVLRDLNLAVLSISILFAFRCILAELFLSKYLNIDVKKDMVLELMMSFIFIVTAWFFNGFLGITIYLLFLLIYFILKRKDIKFALDTLKNVTQGNG